MLSLKRYKFVRAFLSFFLTVSFFLQPFAANASICEELAKVVNKIGDAVGKVNEIKNDKFDEIQTKFEDKVKEDQKAYDDAKTSLDGASTRLEQARKALQESSSEDKSRLQERYNSCKSSYDAAKTKSDNAEEKLKKSKKHCEAVKELVKTVKGHNDNAHDSTKSADDSSKKISGSNVKDKTATGNMQSLNSSASNMQSGQETIRKAGNNLAKVTTALENASKFVGKIKSAFNTFSWALEFIPAIGGIVKGIDLVLTAAKDGLKLASDATKILSETFLSMAESGKTSDAAFLRTLAAKTVSNAPALLWDAGKLVVDVVGLDKLIGGGINKLKNIGTKFLDKHEKIKKFFNGLNFNVVDDLAKKFTDKMSSGTTNWITNHITRDAEKTTEFVTKGFKKLFGGAISGAEKLYKHATGKDVIISPNKNVIGNVKNLLKKKTSPIVDKTAKNLGSMIIGED